MANTYTLISSNVLSTTAASVTFSSIPATYTDLVLRCTTRIDAGATYESFLKYRFNGVGSPNYSVTELRAQGGSAGSVRTTSTANWRGGYIPTPSVTSNTFGSAELYVSNYAGTAQKVGNHFGVQENNSTTDASIATAAQLLNLTSAITSIEVTNNDGDFVSGSSFYLYGIKNS